MFSKIGRLPQFLLLTFSLFTFTLLGISLKPKVAIAEGITHTFTVTIPTATSLQSMYREAAQEVEQYLSDQFSQNLDLHHLRLTVLGARGVEIVPILSVNVTREQWQNKPQLETWATYQPIAYALLFADQKPWQHPHIVTTSAGQTANREASNFFGNSPYPTEEEMRRNPQAYLDEMD